MFKYDQNIYQFSGKKKIQNDPSLSDKTFNPQPIQPSREINNLITTNNFSVVWSRTFKYTRTIVDSV